MRLSKWWSSRIATALLASSLTGAQAQAAEPTIDDYVQVAAGILVYMVKCKSMPDVPERTIRGLNMLRALVVKDEVSAKAQIESRFSTVRAELEKEPAKIEEWCQTVYKTMVGK